MNIYLDKLELHGFKSFPDKTIIKFHKGITAVIGPNGCGKSNIVDAVLWVLGEQKIKSLRGENSEDLIFNGSADKKPLGMTEVGAHFIKDYEPVYIARRYYRSAETKYILNEKYCRNRDVQNALYDMQMGEKKYFIFEQGSIDKLVQLKAGEKRILIEEAAGVSQYLERKKETVNKLIIAQQNLESLDMLIFDKENRLKELKNQVNYVQRYRNYKLEKINNLKALIQKKYNKIQKEVKGNLILKDDNINKETVLIRDINAIEKVAMEFEEEKWLIDQEQKKFEKIKFETNSSIISTKKEIEKKNQEQGFNRQRVSDLKRERDNNISELKKIEPLIENAEEELQKNKEKLKIEKENYDEINSKISKLKKEIEAYKDENKNIKSEIFTVQSKVSSDKNRLNKLERTKLLEENEIKNKNRQLREIDIAVIDNDIIKKKKEIEKLEAEFVIVKNNLDLHTRTKNNYSENINQDRKTINEIENEMSSLNKQREKYLEIKKKISGVKNLENGDSKLIPLQDILEASENNFKIIENYFFDEMDALFLHNNNIPENLNDKYIIGRDKTRLIADKVKNEIEKEDGFISFVSSLYTLDNKEYKRSLKEGVLVDNLDNGIKIFLKFGYGIVTKEAIIINENGIIINNRDKGILNVNKEIKTAEEETKKLNKKLIKVQDKQAKLKEKFKQISSSIEKEQVLVRVQEKELFLKKSELENLIRDKDKYKKRVDVLKSEIAIIEQNEKELNAELKKTNDSLNILQKKEKELILKSENFRSNLDKKKEKINDVEKKYIEHKNSLNLLKERIHSITSKITSQKNIKNNLSQQNVNKMEKTDELLKRSEAVKKAVGLLNEELEIFDIRAKENDSLLIETGKKSNLLNQKIRENTENLNKLRKQLSEIKADKSGIEIALSGYKKDIFQLEELALKELNDELKNIKGSSEFLEKELYDLERDVDLFDDKLHKMSDSDKLNFSAESEYEVLYKAQGSMLTQKEDVIKSIQDMHDVIEKIDSESKINFLKAFNNIKEKFVENFKILFEGGDATLKLTDENNLLETGLDIKAQPPGKQLLSLRLLSGGEKTLTSLAFLFALFQYKPAPFCIFDEVDASLDEANIQRFLKFMHTLKKNTQFLIITHNFKTMEEADYLYGISMNEPGISTIYSTKFSNTK